MPWNESTKMDEKLKFVSRYLDGEKIATLCQEFGISRVTGHKIIDRYKDSGLEALYGSISTTISASQPLALPGRAIDREPEKRVPNLGRS